MQAIDTSSVHRITSGQVIIDLTSAAKELVENSVDANASVVEVRFKNHGVDSIEVIDNGDGIPKGDYEGIGMSITRFLEMKKILTLDALGRKYHTSKLRSYEDLLMVQTFGFRGEALSSLCSLADVQVITCTKEDVPLATQISLDSKGEILSKTATSGSKGTHVIITNLFQSLPVRRKDFMKNAKREFTKAVSLLQAYAIICTDVKITVSNSAGNSNKKSILFSTPGRANLKASIASIYGAPIFEKLMPINISFDLEYSQPTLKTDTSLTEGSGAVSIEGYVSKPIFGHGRSASDRQLYYINSRPCILPQVAKAFNETYKVFNSAQLPAVIVNIKLDTARYDINVSPDKRTILLHSETLIIEMIKENLIALFENTGHSIPRSTLEIPHPQTRTLVQGKLFSSFSNKLNTTHVIKTSAKTNTNGKPSSATRQEKEDEESESEPDDVVSDSIINELSDDTSVQPDTEQTFYCAEMSPQNPIHTLLGSRSAKRPLDTTLIDEISRPTRVLISETDLQSDETDEPQPLKKRKEDLSVLKSENENKNNSNEEDTSENRPGKDNLSPCQCTTQGSNHIHPTVPTQVSQPTGRNQSAQRSRTHNYDMPTKFTKRQLLHGKRDMKNLEKITNRLLSRHSKPHNGDLPRNTKTPLSNIVISDIGENQEAVESLLNLSIHKKDFLTMEIVGQFNLGFILVTNWNESTKKKDLFIVDQHASDEIFNFERLQRETVIESQPLIIPLPLELTAMEELTLTSNPKVFEENGFKIHIDEEKPPGSKCKLTALPLSKSTTFDLKDIHELIYLLETHPGQSNIKCSKLRSMFAMRACRSSIMIGKPLNRKVMTRVVNNLSTLDRPWNCPHGRPTMRHLVNLGQFTGSLDDYLDQL